MLALDEFVLWVNADKPYNTAKQYIDAAKQANGAFKMGAFATALDFKLPILPIAVAGTYRVWRPGTIWVRSAPVVLEGGESISVEGLGSEDRARLRDRTHAAVAERRTRARARHPGCRRGSLLQEDQGTERRGARAHPRGDRAYLGRR